MFQANGSKAGQGRRPRGPRGTETRGMVGRRRGRVLGAVVLSLAWLCLCSVAQSCPTCCKHMDCSPPGPSVREIFQTRILKSIAISYSRASPLPRDLTRISCVFCVGRGMLHQCTTWKALNMSIYHSCGCKIECKCNLPFFLNQLEEFLL